MWSDFWMSKRDDPTLGGRFVTVRRLGDPPTLGWGGGVRLVLVSFWHPKFTSHFLLKIHFKSILTLPNRFQTHPRHVWTHSRHIFIIFWQILKIFSSKNIYWRETVRNSKEISLKQYKNSKEKKFQKINQNPTGNDSKCVRQLWKVVGEVSNHVGDVSKHVWDELLWCWERFLKKMFPRFLTPFFWSRFGHTPDHPP